MYHNPVWSSMFSAILILGLAGCQDQDTNGESSLSIPLPEIVSTRSIMQQESTTARIEISQLGISRTLVIDGDRAIGTWPKLPPGRYTVDITFETDLPDSGNIVLARASKKINVTSGDNTLSFHSSDYSHPDEDGDKYSNLAEISAGTDPLNINSRPQPARVFVTSAEGTAKLADWPDAGGKSGLAAGDAICQARAEAAGLPGRFMAWLSDRNHDAYCRVHGLNGKKSEKCGQATLPATAGPWVRMDGYPLADGISGLTGNGGIYTPLVFIESGEQIFRNGALGLAMNIWTGTDSGGAWADELPVETPDGIAWGAVGDCNNWNSDEGDPSAVAVGSVFSSDSRWTSQTTAGECSGIAALACFEIHNNAPLPNFREPGKRVFITSVYGTGDLSGWADAGGRQGVQAGDAICRARARTAGLSNADKFKAFLADDTTTAIDRLMSNGPWVRMDGVPVAETKEDLVVTQIEDRLEGGTFSSILLDEKGEYIDYVHTLVWLGAGWSGRSSPHNCSNWTSSDEEAGGTVTMAYFSDLMWLNPSPKTGRLSCNLSLRLYCFEDE